MINHTVPAASGGAPENQAVHTLKGVIPMKLVDWPLRVMNVLVRHESAHWGEGGSIYVGVMESEMNYSYPPQAAGHRIFGIWVIARSGRSRPP